MPTQQTQFLSELKSVNTVNLAKLISANAEKTEIPLQRKEKFSMCTTKMLKQLQPNSSIFKCTQANSCNSSHMGVLVQNTLHFF